MSKKWMLIAGAAAVVIVALVAVVMLTSQGKPTTATTTTGAGSTTTSTTTAGTGSTTTGGATGATGTAVTSTSTTTGGSTTAGGTKTPAAVTFPPLPAANTKAKAAQPKAPVAPGKSLVPLVSAPDPTIAALVANSVPEGSQYAIVMRPLGIGPPLATSSRIVVYVYSVKPIGSAPVNTKINRNYVLTVANTKNGGGVTKGGSYKATVTFVTVDGKMVPVLSKATLVKG